MNTISAMFNYDLSHANTMALKCIARTFVKITDVCQIKPVIDFAKEQKLPIFILSGGSNVLLPNYLDALVISPSLFGIQIVQESDERIIISVQSGENWHALIETCLKNGWYGLENLALIPGLVGASPVQNVGAYGVQVSDFIDYVIAYDLMTGEKMLLNNQACQFAYRDSFFKQNPNRYLITEVAFCLHKNPNQVIASYGDVKKVAQQISTKNQHADVLPSDVFEAVISIRQEKLPDPKMLPNCGSFFKNPIIQLEKFHQLKQKFADLPCYAVDESQVKLPAGWLIDKSGLKGKGVAPILTHKNQALVLVNNAPNQATQQDIQNAQNFIIEVVNQTFGVVLEREPVWVDSQGGVS